MPDGRLLERIAIVVLAIGLVWEGAQHRKTRTDLNRLALHVEAAIEAQKARQAEAAEAAQAQAAARLPATPWAPDPAAGGTDFELGGGFPEAPQALPAEPGAAPPVARPRRPRKRAPPLPGAAVLSRLYDAADAAAADEGWSPEVYDEVVLVFEDSTELMRLLWEDLKQRRVTLDEARGEVELLREDAQGRLTEILGEDGFERLRTRVADR